MPGRQGTANIMENPGEKSVSSNDPVFQLPKIKFLKIFQGSSPEGIS